MAPMINYICPPHALSSSDFIRRSRRRNCTSAFCMEASPHIALDPRVKPEDDEIWGCDDDEVDIAACDTKMHVGGFNNRPRDPIVETPQTYLTGVI